MPAYARNDETSEPMEENDGFERTPMPGANARERVSNRMMILDSDDRRRCGGCGNVGPKFAHKGMVIKARRESRVSFHAEFQGTSGSDAVAGRNDATNW